MSSVLSAHPLIVAAIAVPYFGLMAGLFAYMAAQLRDHEKPHSDTEQDHDPVAMVLAA